MEKQCSGHLYFLLKTKAKFTTFGTFYLQNSFGKAESNKLFLQKLLQYLCFEVGCFQIDQEAFYKN